MCVCAAIAQTHPLPVILRLASNQVNESLTTKSLASHLSQIAAPSWKLPPAAAWFAKRPPRQQVVCTVSCFRSARLAAQFVGPTVLTCCMARAVRSEAAAASSSWVSRCVLSFNRVFASRRMVAYQSSSTQTTRRVSTGRGTSTTPLLLYAPAKQPRYNHHHTTQPPPYPRAINGHWHNDDQYSHDHGQANHPICTL